MDIFNKMNFPEKFAPRIIIISNGKVREGVPGRIAYQ